MSRKCIISAVAMIITTWAMTFVVHGLILGPEYKSVAGMRPEAEAHTMMPFMVLAHLAFGVAFAWIYIQGKDDRPWLGQGLRFGVAVAFLTIVPTYLIYHVVTPVPFALAIKQIALDFLRPLLMGVIVAWINR
jgi:hypothetical protein